MAHLHIDTQQPVCWLSPLLMGVLLVMSPYTWHISRLSQLSRAEGQFSLNEAVVVSRPRKCAFYPGPSVDKLVLSNVVWVGWEHI